MTRDLTVDEKVKVFEAALDAARDREAERLSAPFLSHPLEAAINEAIAAAFEAGVHFAMCKR